MKVNKDDLINKIFGNMVYREHSNDRSKKGKVLIKQEYMRRRKF